MSTAKEEIFRRIREAGNIPTPELPRNYRQEAEIPGVDIVAEMEEKLVDYTAVVSHAKPGEESKAIAAFLDDMTSLVVPPGLEKAWLKDIPESVEIRVDEPLLSKAELDATDAVLTASRVAVSLSGTIMLDGTPDMGRRAITLVPDTHVCVLKASDIKATVPAAVAVLAEHPERPTTWIAGPSATSDIELVRVDGVHGPRNLRVVIVDDVEA